VQPQRLYADLTRVPDPTRCDECQRLMKAHRAAVEKNNKLGDGTATRGGEGAHEAWLKATREARSACRKTLADLNQHKALHG
jgi:hypothetical protein